jgi:VWFA-related protein
MKNRLDFFLGDSCAHIFSVFVLLCLLFYSAPGQQPSQTPAAEKDDDVIRINTDLVQTDVVVLDRQGRFVDGLQRDQFELRVDTQPQTISFFERIMAGTLAEEKQLAVGRAQPSVTSVSLRTAETSEHQRTSAFFVDDVHLGPEEILRARKLLQGFVDNDMLPGDQVLIASASGQVGFLQQFTNNKQMLRAAIARLRYQSQARLDTPLLPMTGYEALAVDRNEWSVINKKVNEVLANYSLPNTRRERIADLKARAEQEVRNAARQILQQARHIDQSMLTTLESLARGSAGIRGRKLLFFLSEGFVIDRRSSDIQDRLQRVVDAAARNGVVIYTVDPRGLSAAFADASSEVVATESHVDTTSTDISVSHQVLVSLAADTGGRAILNNNNLEAGISKAFEEVSNYYLLAWHPDVVEQGKPKFRQLRVSIKGRPDLKVLARRGFFSSSYQPSKENARQGNETSVSLPTSALNKQLNSPFVRHDIPVSLYSSFTNDVQRGSVLTVSARLRVVAPESSERSTPDIDVVYVVLNHEGKTVAGSRQKLTEAPTIDKARSLAGFLSESSVPLAPGLYQIRVAAQDNHDGRIGSAFDWIEIPKFEPKHLSLSSLLLSEQKVGDTQSSRLNVERAFARTSRLLCQTYIYNAAPGRNGEPPQITMEVKVFYHNELIANVPPHSLSLGALHDYSRIPYAVPIPLESMPTGTYTLNVTVSDRNTSASATQNINFMIE